METVYDLNLYSAHSEPKPGVWLRTSVIERQLSVVVEYRQCSAVLASDHWYNELCVWSLTDDGSYKRLEYMEQLSRNKAQATTRHCEVVERLVSGQELVEIEE